MSTIYVMEAANLFCGSHDPSASKHLTLSELKLPDLQENYTEHHPGGSRVGIEINTGIQKLESTFKLTGFDPQVLAQFGLGTKQSKFYTAYGVILDKSTGENHELKAVFQARLGKVAPDAFSRGDVQGHEYSLNEIMHYELWFKNEEKVFFDFFTNTWRIDGVDQNAVANGIMRIG